MKSSASLPVFVLLSFAASLAIAQAPPPGARVDPYTAGDREVMAKAGYASFGPFDFGKNHGTEDIDKLLPSEPLVWIETAHFRIGASLLPCKVDRAAGDKEWLGGLTMELQRLGQRIPGVKADAKVLDPWLRAHLVAQRAEEAYAEVSSVLGVSDDSFSRSPGDPSLQKEFMGLGPYFGQREKFTILLVQKATSLSRYTAAHHGWATSQPTKHHDHEFGTAFFGAAEETTLLSTDLSLRTQLTFNVAWLLYTSYRSYSHNLPIWIPVGLAQWHARKITTRHPVYDLEPGADGRKRYEQWSKRWLPMLRARSFEPLPTLFTRMDVNVLSMDQHLQCWALCDHLLAAHRPQFVEFLHRMKDPFHGRIRFPTIEELQVRQRDSLQSAFGCDVVALEESWRRQPGARTTSAR